MGVQGSRHAAGPASAATVDAEDIAAMDIEDFVAICAEKPAIHRFPASMGTTDPRTVRPLVDDYDGDAGRIWTDVADADELRDRLRPLPGYGEEKTKIFIAILAKRLGIAPDGWEAVAAPFSDDEPRSVADVSSRGDAPGGPPVEEGDEGGQEVQAGRRATDPPDRRTQSCRAVLVLGPLRHRSLASEPPEQHRDARWGRDAARARRR